MEIKIKIKTPKGQATRTEKKIKPFIIGKNILKKHETFVNDEDDTIIWVVNTDVRRAIKIQKNVLLFDTTINKIFNSKMLKKTLIKKLEPGQEEELKDMLMNHTKVDIIKDASSEELATYGKETWWDVIRDKFRKSES